MKNILLIESDIDSKGKGKVRIHTKEETLTVGMSSRFFEKKLSAPFIRVSRFSIVNVDYLSRINHSDQTIYLQGYKYVSGLGDKYEENLILIILFMLSKCFH
jgi:DNA-binding LytR/AlgR family response regulator